MNLEKIQNLINEKKAGEQTGLIDEVFNDNANIQNFIEKTNVNDTEVFEWCYKEHLKNKSYTNGNRNSFITSLSVFCCEYGVSEQTCLNECVNSLKQPDQDYKTDFESVIKSVYNNHTFGTKKYIPKNEYTEPKKQNNNLEKMINTKNELQNLINTEIVFSKPILLHNNNAVVFPNTINVIQGQSGSHKSRLGEHIASAFIKKQNYENSLLGYEATNSKEIVLCYVDTERNLTDQLPYALQSIQIKAGYSKQDKPENYDFTSLLEIERTQRFESLKSYIDMIRKQTDKHVVLILDVVTDCIADFNKVDETMKLIDLMNISINKYDITFICIIHENPAGQKARGHLGTEIMNKASTVMQVSFEKDSQNNDTDIIRVKYLKCRSTQKYEPFYVKYCNIEKNLIFANDKDVSDLINNRKHKASEYDMIEFIETYLADTEMTNAILLDKLCKDFKASSKTISNRLQKIIESENELVNSKNETCFLRKKKLNKEVIFYLDPKRKDYENYYEVDD